MYNVYYLLLICACGPLFYTQISQETRVAALCAYDGAARMASPEKHGDGVSQESNPRVQESQQSSQVGGRQKVSALFFRAIFLTKLLQNKKERLFVTAINVLTPPHIPI